LRLGANARHRGLASFAEATDAYLTRERLTVYPVATLVLFVVAVIGTVWARDARPLPDFAARWTAGHLLVTGQIHALYDPVAQFAVQSEHLNGSGLSLFVSPPFVAVLFAPFGAVPYSVACVIWGVVTVGSLLLSLALLRNLTPSDSPLRRPGVALPILASYPILEHIGAGQDTGIVLLVVLVGIRLLGAGRPLLAGGVLALSLMKPHLAFLVPIVLLVEKQCAAVLAFALGALSLAGLSIGVAGWQGCAQWLELVLGSAYADFVQRGQAWKSSSLPGLLSAIVPADAPRAWELVGLALGVVAVSLTVIALFRQRRTTLTTWGLALGATCLASPHTMVYDLVLAVPMVYALTEVAWNAMTRMTLLGWTLGLFLVPPAHALVQESSWPVLTLSAPWHVAILFFLWRLMLRETPNATRADQRVRGPTAASPPRKGVGCSREAQL
jgi:hypothetical protein